MLTILVIVILVLLLAGAWPHGPWYGQTGAGWGYYPMGAIGLILIVVLILILLRGPLVY